MSNIMTKRGSQDNVITYEHYCDTKADLANIPQSQISLGSVAIVLQDDNGGMGIYLANSNKEWISFSSGEGGGGSDMSNNSLADLLDISLAEPVDGQTLVYNGETEKWENKESSGSGNVMIVNAIIDNQSETTEVTVDKSFLEVLNFVKNGGFVVLYAQYNDSNDTTKVYYLENASDAPNYQIKFFWRQWRLIYGSLTVSAEYIYLYPNRSTDGATIEDTKTSYGWEEYPLATRY